MARADREAVLRGVNARFDEEGDDQAVIAALGTPTFAAVSVLRGYTPPDDLDEDSSGEEDYQYVEPVIEPAAGEPETQPAAGTDGPEPAGEALPEQEAEEAVSEPEVQPAEAPEAPEAGEELSDEAPEAAGQPEPETDEAENEPCEPEPEQAPELEPDAANEPDEVTPDEPAVEAQTGSEPEEESASGDESSVFAGLDIEIYSDGSVEPEAESESGQASLSDEPAQGSASEPEAEPVPAPESEGAECEPEEADFAGQDAAEEFVSAEEIELDYPEPEPERAKPRGGRVFVCALLTLIPGVPVGVVLTAFALALLITGAALAYAGGIAISFAFLGMSVVADILLCLGFGLIVGAVGLMLVFLAVWFFLRCVIGLYGRVFARMGAWSRGEEAGQ